MQLKSILQKQMTAVIFYFLFCPLLTSAQTSTVSSNSNLILPAATQTMRLYWKGDTINSKWEEHAALLLPVRFKHCAKTFYMQFDTGSPNSIFYKNKLAAIRARYPKAVLPAEEGDKLLHISFTIDKMQVTATQIAVKQFDSTGIQWNDEHAIEIIGSIGVDLLDGKVALLDYPNRKLTLSDVLPAAINKKVVLTDFIYIQRRIMLPATIKGKQTILFFDSGSSMFELLTDQKTAQSLAAANSVFEQSQLKSWDKYVTANSIATNDSIGIGGSSIAIGKATFIDGVSDSQVAQMMKMGIGGMTGNKLFVYSTLVIDTKNKRFGIVPQR